MIRICVAGATGWVGRALLPAISAATDLQLVGAVARSAAGQQVHEGSRVTIKRSVAEALVDPTDVLIDYTSQGAAKANIIVAIEHGVHAVLGTSGLAERDFAEIAGASRDRRVGVLAAGNFAISAVLLQRFAILAARFMPTWEILDYAKAGKSDAPSGTARELASRLAEVGKPHLEVPIEETHGPLESRGATIGGTQVHSIRLPGFVIGAEVIFGRPGELLSLRADAGTSADPYVDGTLFATRRVSGLVGLHRGLDTVMDLSCQSSAGTLFSTPPSNEPGRPAGVKAEWAPRDVTGVALGGDGRPIYAMRLKMWLGLLRLVQRLRNIVSPFVQMVTRLLYRPASIVLPSTIAG